MRRMLLAAVAASSVLLSAVHSDAQVAVACVTCSTLAEQLISDAKQVQQYATEVSSLQTQLRQYSNMVQNTVALPEMVWTSVTNDITRVRNLANEASILTGNSGTILSRLAMAQGYANQVITVPSQMGNQFTQWQNTLANANRSLGQTVSAQQSQMLGYTSQQTSIQTQAATAAGQMQAIQAGVSMAALTNTQLQQIQTTLVAQAQLASAQSLIAEDRAAQEDAAEQAFVNGAPVALTGYQGF
jgi:P-type conjugative transfer protein TrbJ